MRLLFRWVGLPVAVPAGLADLARVAKADNCPDGPAVMARIRNTITHPTRKNREQYDRHPDAARVEAWELGLWALELCILRLCDYTGTYSNRLAHRYAWEQDLVPWAK